MENVANGTAGPCYAYYGVHPSEATVGYTEGGIKWQCSTSTLEIKFDQRGVGPVKKIITGRSGTVTLMIAEDVLESYRLMFAGTVITTDIGDPTSRKMVVGQSIGLDLLTIAKSLLLKPAEGAGPSTDPNRWVRFFKAVPTDTSPTVEYSRDNQRIFEVVFDYFPSDDDLDEDGQPALFVIGDETAVGTAS